MKDSMLLVSRNWNTVVLSEFGGFVLDTHCLYFQRTCIFQLLSLDSPGSCTELYNCAETIWNFLNGGFLPQSNSNHQPGLMRL